MRKTEQHVPYSQEVDFLGRFRPNELMNYLADFARRHADQSGYGYHEMKRQNLFWAVHRFVIDMPQIPKLEQEFSCTTAAWFRKGLRADRQFELTDADNCLVRAYTRWILMDWNTRKPVPIQRYFPEQGEPLFDPHDLSVLLPEASEISHAGTRTYAENEQDRGKARVLPETRRFTVSYSDIDVHQHCNNSRYMSWCLDMIGVNQMKQSFPRRLDIRFLREAFAGDEIEIVRERRTWGEVFFGTATDERVFELTLYWEFPD